MILLKSLLETHWAYLLTAIAILVVIISLIFVYTRSRKGVKGIVNSPPMDEEQMKFIDDNMEDVPGKGGTKFKMKMEFNPPLELKKITQEEFDFKLLSDDEKEFVRQYYISMNMEIPKYMQ